MAGPSPMEQIATPVPTPSAGLDQVNPGWGASEATTSWRDPVIAEVATWMAAKDAVEALQQDWLNLEQRLSQTIGPLKMDLLEDGRSGLPEARAMRALTRKMQARDRELERAAHGIVHMRASSVAGVLAKIELGLRIQGHYDWQDNALALVQGGIEQLRELC